MSPGITPAAQLRAFTFDPGDGTVYRAVFAMLDEARSAATYVGPTGIFFAFGVGNRPVTGYFFNRHHRIDFGYFNEKLYGCANGYPTTVYMAWFTLLLLLDRELPGQLPQYSDAYEPPQVRRQPISAPQSRARLQRPDATGGAPERTNWDQVFVLPAVAAKITQAQASLLADASSYLLRVLAACTVTPLTPLEMVEAWGLRGHSTLGCVQKACAALQTVRLFVDDGGRLKINPEEIERLARLAATVWANRRWKNSQVGTYATTKDSDNSGTYIIAVRRARRRAATRTSDPGGWATVGRGWNRDRTPHLYVERTIKQLQRKSALCLALAD